MSEDIRCKPAGMHAVAPASLVRDSHYVVVDMLAEPSQVVAAVVGLLVVCSYPVLGWNLSALLLCLFSSLFFRRSLEAVGKLAGVVSECALLELYAGRCRLTVPTD